MEKDIQHILIVDDLEENLFALEEALDFIDVNIIKARSGKEALTLVLEHFFAVVLLDVQMPDMDGFETAELMRAIKQTQHIPIIFVTAISKEQKYVFKGYGIGAVDYLYKPLNPDILKSKVNVFLTLNKQQLELKKSKEDIIQKNQELRAINTEISALFEITTTLNRSIEMDILLENILWIVKKNTIFDFSKKFALYLPEGEKIVLVKTDDIKGEPEKQVGAKQEKCLCFFYAEKGELVINTSCKSDHCLIVQKDKEQPEQYHVIVPFAVSDKILGFLCLTSSGEVMFSEYKKYLLLTVGNQIGIAIEKAKMYKETKKLALHDSLTGLANRRMMNILMEKHFGIAKRYKQPFSVIIFDVDKFKDYNDTKGHQAGDQLLVKIAKSISGSIRDSDLAVRFGGDEFVLLLPETPLDGACTVAERIRLTVMEKAEIPLSFGVSTFHKEITSKEDLIKYADRLLYKAKAAGGNQICS